MYFIIDQAFLCQTCAKPLHIYIEEAELPKPETNYTFSCPACASHLFLRSGAAQVIEAIPPNGILATRAPLTTIIVIDDEADIRDSMAALLQSMEGFSIRTCPSRDAALELLEQERPNLVIVDWNMPGMTLECFVELVRRRYGLLPMVLYSTAPNALAKANALAIPFMSKTDDPEKLISTIQQLCTIPHAN